MTPAEWYALVLVALTAELDEMDRTGPTEERVARAESYLAWLKANAGDDDD